MLLYKILYIDTDTDIDRDIDTDTYDAVTSTVTHVHNSFMLTAFYLHQHHQLSHQNAYETRSVLATQLLLALPIA